MAGDNVNSPDKVEARALQPGENNNLSHAVDFKSEQTPLAFKPERSDKNLPPDFQLDFGTNDIYSSGLGDFSSLGKSAPALDLYPKGKPITFDVGETKVAEAQAAPSAETVVKAGDNSGTPAETVVKAGDSSGTPAEAAVKPGDNSGTPAETVVKAGDDSATPAEAGSKVVEFPPHPVQDKETYWSIAKDHLKETGGHDPSDTEVMNYMKRLAKHNGLTLEQAAHIDHNDVVHFPPEKQASAAAPELAKTGKEAGADGKQGNLSAGEVKEGNNKAHVPDVVVPVELPANQHSAELHEEQQKVAEHPPESQPQQVAEHQSDSATAVEAEHNAQAQVKEAQTKLPANGEEKFEPTDFTV